MSTTTGPQRADTTPTAAPAPAQTEPAVGPPPKLRRRPALVATAVAAICAGALLAGWAWTATSGTVSVLAARSSIERGAVITDADLIAVQVGVDPALHPVPASRAADVVGRRAAGDVAAGTLLTLAQVTDAVLPRARESVVGVGLPAAAMPGEPLLVGDRVRVVATPGQSGEVTAGEQVTIAAIVVGVRVNDETGQYVVSVQVPEGQAAELAARAATGNVALVLDSRER